MKRQKDEEGGQEWLNTYADMITLVLTFFVLLYSISNVNLTKLEEVASATLNFIYKHSSREQS